MRYNYNSNKFGGMGIKMQTTKQIFFLKQKTSQMDEKTDTVLKIYSVIADTFPSPNFKKKAKSRC